MTYLILIAVSLILFGGFLLLTAFERGQGMRMAGTLRNRLDAKVARLSFIVAHVDWSAFAKHLASSAASKVAHDAAHAVLLLVRALERMLTHAVKSLRERREHTFAGRGEQASLFNRALTGVRRALAQSRVIRRRESRRQASEGTDSGTDA